MVVSSEGDIMVKTYFYKRKLFALVPKANLIPSSNSLQIAYTLNLYSQDILTKNLFTSLITKFFKDLIPRLFQIYTLDNSNIRPKKQWIQRV
jgi:hypothetical protein